MDFFKFLNKKEKEISGGRGQAHPGGAKKVA